MTIRAKFTVESIKHYAHMDGIEISMRPVWDTGIPEDARFHRATPSGELTMHVTNPAVAEFLKPGRSFYLDFTPAEPPPTA